MRFIARFAMRGPLFAAAAAALAQLASLSIGLLIIVSGAIVGLVALRHGSREGLRVIVLATSLTVAARIAFGGAALPMLILCLIVWLPSWLMAINLGRTRQQALPLMMIAVLVTAYAAAIRMVVGDVTAFWFMRLQPLFEILMAESAAQLSDAQIELIAAQLHGWSLIAMFCILAAIFLLARWWQAVLFNPGGFGTEFCELRLPRVAMLGAGLAAVALVVLSLSGLNAVLAGDAFVIVVVLFAFQGLAVVHYRARAVALAGGWLTGLYVLLMVTPQIVGPILATTGVADGLADFRRLKVPPETENGGGAGDDNGDG